MPLCKVTIEVDCPYGYEPVAYRVPVIGEQYLSGGVVYRSSVPAVSQFMIVRKTSWAATCEQLREGWQRCLENENTTRHAHTMANLELKIASEQYQKALRESSSATTTSSETGSTPTDGQETG